MMIENIFEDLLINFPPATQTRSTTNASVSEVAQSTLLSASQNSQNRGNRRNEGSSTSPSSTGIAQIAKAAQEKDEIFIKLPPYILEIILTYDPNTIKSLIKFMGVSRAISPHEKNITKAILNKKDLTYNEINKKIKELESRHKEIFSKMDASICNAFSKEGGCKKSEEEYAALEMQAYPLEDEIALLRDLKTSLQELERLKLRHF